MGQNKVMTVRRCLITIASVLSGFVLIFWCPLASAQQSSSTNYSVNEVYFGSGGDLNDCSTNYCAKNSVGELNVGKASSTNYQEQAGFNQERDPSLTLNVMGGVTDIGVLSTGSTKTTTSTFSIKSYLASGYSAQIIGVPPTNSLPTNPRLHNLTTPTASSAGTEQFGINLVANTSPATFGSAPVQVPDSTFGFGTAASGYNTANLYKYNNGDVIATSASSSGETDYTISYIFNISPLTPAGTYVYNGVIVATSTF